LQFFFSVTLFLSSALLFLVQPMIAKMVLPLLGGTPAVWNTCMVFFQAALLAGYAYAHAFPAWMGIRRHAILHLVLLILPFAVLPLAIPNYWTPPEDSNPIPWLLGFLAVSVGLPFFALSTNAPLIQMWFADTGHRSAKDPYFLYAASNLGSMLALLSYPIILEPSLPVAAQTRIWTIGYGTMVLLMFLCVVILWRAPKAAPSVSIANSGEHAAASDSPTPKTGKSKTNPATVPISLQPLGSSHSALVERPVLTRLHWIALAFVPSSLMLSVTMYLTTDIAAIPLLWVVPLAIYLFTFILGFSRRPPLPHAIMVRVSPLVVLVLVIVMLTQATEPIWILLPLHLLAFFVIALVCHGELAARRPPIQHLTEFYLWLAVGGVLGGVFNAILAPLLFSGVVEYPLVLALACILRPAIPSVEWEEPRDRRSERKRKRKGSPPPSPTPAQDSEPASRHWILRPLALDFLLPAILGLATAGMVLIVQKSTPGHSSFSVGIMFGIPAVICYTFLDRSLRFGLAIGGLLLAGSFYMGVYGDTIHRERSFFGVHRITLEETTNRNGEVTKKEHVLVHGNTVHGRQNTDPERRHDPLTYYYRTGPIGKVFAAFSGSSAKKEVALVGLGAGALAAYGEPGQHFTFYEIDPAVVRIARDEGYFTYLGDSKAAIDYVLGDARITLKKASDRQYGMIIMDAFSSDSIPLHLLTREAFQLYKQKLADNGLLIIHFSNRYLDLEPILGDLAADAGLHCWVMNDLSPSKEEKEDGKTPSRWVVMARNASDLGTLRETSGWQEVFPRRGMPVWTDDFSNLFSVFIWRQPQE
jgi:hypothetical protein